MNKKFFALGNDTAIPVAIQENAHTASVCAERVK